MNCLRNLGLPFLPRFLNSLRPSQVSAGPDRASVRRRRGRGGSRRHRSEISPNHFYSHPLAVIYLSSYRVFWGCLHVYVTKVTKVVLLLLLMYGIFECEVFDDLGSTH